MKAERPIGIPMTDQARVHSDDRGELCLKTSWSPKIHLTTSRGETLLKEILDFIFQDEPYLDNHRPAWLGGLELDRYYTKLKLGFEYQGFQHTYFVPDFHKGLQDLKTQKQRDRRKKKLCRERKVILVTVEYWALSVGQVCQRIDQRTKKYKRWGQTEKIRAYASSTAPRASGRLKERKVLNKKCLTYKKLIKANYKSGKWVKRQAYQERSRLAKQGRSQ